MGSTDIKDAAGYLYLWRRLADHPIMSRNPMQLKLWIWLLIKAAPERLAVYRGVRAGELATTYAELADVLAWSDGRSKDVRPSRRTIARLIDDLVADRMIEYLSTSKGLLLRVTNYEEWQGDRGAQQKPLDDNWQRDPQYDSNKMRAQWETSIGALPRRLPFGAAEMAFEKLHDEDHYTRADVLKIIDTIAENKTDLRWVITAGPPRLRQLCKNGLLAAEVVLTWTKQNEKRQRRTYSGASDDGLAAAIGELTGG